MMYTPTSFVAKIVEHTILAEHPDHSIDWFLLASLRPLPKFGTFKSLLSSFLPFLAGRINGGSITWQGSSVVSRSRGWALAKATSPIKCDLGSESVEQGAKSGSRALQHADLLSTHYGEKVRAAVAEAGRAQYRHL